MAKNNKVKSEDLLNESNNLPPMDANNTKLDAIKEIIFGQNMREYEVEFNEIRTHINTNLDAVSIEFSKVRKLMDEMEKRLSAKVEENHQAMMSQMESFLSDDYAKTIKSIENKLENLDEKKIDRKKIGKMLADLGSKLSS